MCFLILLGILLFTKAPRPAQGPPSLLSNTYQRHFSSE